ncbi:MAG: hypothetical protein IJI14_07285 [Anaerolineaceae bacterium]|nr:hypothetical protein [Anaerolineaceae bacterium]
MANSLLTADQVKEYLNIPDFRHITKDKLIEFVSTIPDMDKEVAIKAIEQFPEFCNYAKVMVAHYETMCQSILNENGQSAQIVMNGYEQTLKVLAELAKNDDLDPADKRFFAEKMVEVADRMAAFDTSNKSFLAGITKCFTYFAGGSILLGVSLLGVKIIGRMVPRTA